MSEINALEHLVENGHIAGCLVTIWMTRAPAGGRQKIALIPNWLRSKPK